MNLTTEQIDSVKDGEPISIVPPEIGVECVIVRADIFARVKELTYNDADFSPREAYHLVDRVMADDDAGDKSLDQYQHYRRKP